MKTLILTLACAFFSVGTLFSQIKEGHISYSIELTSDNADMQLAIGMMQGSTLEVFFKDQTTRAEMNMGTLIKVTTISDDNSGDVLMLMNGIVGQKAIKTTAEELNEQLHEKPVYKITLVEESKLIMDYECKKAILTDEDGQENIFWYNQDIQVAKKGQQYLYEDIPGFPMQYEINNNGLKMVMTVTTLKTQLDNNTTTLFEMNIPEGFKELSVAQVKTLGM